MLQKLSSAAVVIAALRMNNLSEYFRNDTHFYIEGVPSVVGLIIESVSTFAKHFNPFQPNELAYLYQ